MLVEQIYTLTNPMLWTLLSLLLGVLPLKEYHYVKSQSSFTHHPEGRTPDCSSLEKFEQMMERLESGTLTAFLYIYLLFTLLLGNAFQQIPSLVYRVLCHLYSMIGQLMHHLETQFWEKNAPVFILPCVTVFWLILQ